MFKTQFLFLSAWIVIILGLISLIAVLFFLRSRCVSPNFPGLLLSAIVMMIIGVGFMLANYGYDWTSALCFLIASICGLLGVVFIFVLGNHRSIG